MPVAKELSHSDAVREYLLPFTVEHALKNTRFYREHYAGVTGRVTTLRDLRSLPLFHKSHMTERVDDLRTFSRFPDHLMYTSGTTGVPVEVPVYQEEADAYESLVLLQWQHRHGGSPPLTLSIIRIGHGTHILTGRIPTLPCHINYGIDQFIQMMESYHWVNAERVRPQILDANVLSIRQVTKELLTLGIDPRRFGLEVMVIAGWYMPEWERRFLEETWGALLLEKYGVTEVHGDAKLCLSCKHYHFDFTVIPEVLDVATLEPIEEGIGFMVMTGLYPFNQAIPKIRYVVGDLVEVNRSCTVSSEMGIRFLSRMKDAVRDPSLPGHGYRVFSSDVAEALMPLPDVARKEKTGFLKFKLTATPESQARIEIELVYPPGLFPSRVEEIRGEILQVLYGRCPNLGEPVVHFVKPGTIKEITKL